MWPGLELERRPLQEGVSSCEQAVSLAHSARLLIDARAERGHFDNCHHRYTVMVQLMKDAVNVCHKYAIAQIGKWASKHLTLPISR